MDFAFGLCGFAGGLLCALADLFFDVKGPGNVKSGPHAIIDSNWLRMPDWRFRLSVWIAALGVPLYFMGLLGMSNQLARTSQGFGTAFFLFSIVGASGGFFIHAMLCCFPIIVKTLDKKGIAKETSDQVIEAVYGVIVVPFMVMFCCLVIATSILLIVAILRGMLPLPKWCSLLTPLSLMLIGWLFRKINKETFADLPGIIMPSIGLAMIGLMTAASALH